MSVACRMSRDLATSKSALDMIGTDTRSLTVPRAQTDADYQMENGL